MCIFTTVSQSVKGMKKEKEKKEVQPAEESIAAIS